MISRDLTPNECKGAMRGLRAECFVMLNENIADWLGFRHAYIHFLLFKLNQFESIKAWELFTLMEGISIHQVKRTLNLFQKRGWASNYQLQGEMETNYYITEEGRQTITKIKKKAKVLKRKYASHYVEERSRLRRSVLFAQHSAQSGY
jgi:hypothetical protein